MSRRLPIAVVVVNYNRKELLARCVDSVLGQIAPPSEVIVVDNGSTDGSADMVEARYGDRVKVLRLADNLGFAGGNNRGIEVSAHSWIALINNDAAADPAWLLEMTWAAESMPGAGLVACRILRADRHDLLDNAGVGVWPDGMSRGQWHFCRDAETVGNGVFIPSGCAALIRRDAFEEAGGFDEGFFCYSEDTDLFLRIRLLGWACVMAERAYVYHEGGGGTLGVISPDKLYLVERNRISVMMRYYPARLIAMSPVYTLARYAGLAVRIAGSRRRTGSGRGERILRGGVMANAGALARAYLHAAARVRGDLAARRKWMKMKKAPEGALDRWLIQHRLGLASLFDLDPE